MLDLFSGIGGMSLGLERTDGFQTIAFCEIDPYCRRVLAKHWPEVECFEDVRNLTAESLTHLGRIDVISGGFPCQPISQAGKKRGDKDERWLWPELARLIRAARPRWFLGENVPPLLSAQSGRLFGGILRELAESGYDVEWRSLSAAQFGAPHLRERVFILAYPEGIRQSQQPILTDPAALVGPSARASGGVESGDSTEGIRVGRRIAAGGSQALAHADGKRCDSWAERMGRQAGPTPHWRRQGPTLADAAGEREPLRQTKSSGMGRLAGGSDETDGNHWATEPGIRLLVNGFPGRLEQLRGYGNAVVPQVIEWIGYRILEAEARL